MTEPIRIECRNENQLPTIDEINELIKDGRHIVLHFRKGWFRKFNKKAVIEKLSGFLDECSVFDSGSDKKSEWVTVMPVVKEAIIISMQEKIGRALDAYIEACSNLNDNRLARTLSQEWNEFEHGKHCRFTNSRTGQIVEAPLGAIKNIQQIDPYFFAKFVKSNAAFSDVASLIKDDYHDAKRIIDTVCNDNKTCNSSPQKITE